MFLSAAGAPDASTNFGVLFAGAVVHGALDPVLSSFVPATLQTFFSGGRDALCAMSSVRVVYSVGFSMAQLVSISLSATGNPRLAEQSALLVGLTLLAAACLLYLHLRVCSIDLKTGETGREEEASRAADVEPAAGAGAGNSAAGTTKPVTATGEQEARGT